MVKARIRERGGLNIRIRALIGGRRISKCRGDMYMYNKYIIYTNTIAIPQLNPPPPLLLLPLLLSPIPPP